MRPNYCRNSIDQILMIRCIFARNLYFFSKRVYSNIEHRSYGSSILIDSYFRLHKHRVKILLGTCTLYNVISGAVLMSPSSNTSTAFNIVAKIYFECSYVMSFCLFKQIISSLYFRAWNKCISFDHLHVYSILLTLLMAFLESYIQNRDCPEGFKGNKKGRRKSKVLKKVGANRIGGSFLFLTFQD